MSQENVETFERAVEAINRRDTEALLEMLDPDVTWREVFHVMLGGQATLYRGHEGVREMLRDLYDSFGEIESEYWDVRDLDERVVALGRLRARGTESGAETESPLATLSEFKNGKGIRIQTYLDHQEALEAAGLSE